MRPTSSRSRQAPRAWPPAGRSTPRAPRTSPCAAPTARAGGGGGARGGGGGGGGAARGGVAEERRSVPVAFDRVGVTTDAPLAPLTTLRLGGPADRLVTVEDEGDLVEAVRDADAAGEPLLLLAGGSNLVIADAGFPGLVVRVATRGVDQAPVTDGRVSLTVQAGEEGAAL